MRNWNDCPKPDVMGVMFNSLFKEANEIFKNSPYPFGPEDKSLYKKLRIPTPRIQLRSCNSGRYLSFELERYRKFKYKKSEYTKEILRMVEKSMGIIKANCPASTHAFFFENENGITFIPSIAIYFDADKLTNELFLSDDYNKIYEYYKCILRHELGHVIDYMSFIGKPYNDFKQEFDKRDQVKAKVREKLKGLKGIDYNRTYNEEIIDEVLANKYANFTEDEYNNFISFHHNND